MYFVFLFPQLLTAKFSALQSKFCHWMNQVSEFFLKLFGPFWACVLSEDRQALHCEYCLHINRKLMNDVRMVWKKKYRRNVMK